MPKRSPAGPEGGAPGPALRGAGPQAPQRDSLPTPSLPRLSLLPAWQPASRGGARRFPARDSFLRCGAGAASPSLSPARGLGRAGFCAVGAAVGGLPSASCPAASEDPGEEAQCSRPSGPPSVVASSPPS